MPLYGTAEYWEDHYANDDDETYDWLLPFSKLRSLLVEYAGTTSLGRRSRLEVLIVGCGKAMLSERMYDAGWKTIHAIDVSNIVIRHMKGRQVARKSGKRLRKGLTFEVQDALKLKSTSGDRFKEKYDFIFEKSTLDALLCTRNESTLTVKLYLENIYHSLKFGGTYLVVSLGPPARRLSKLKQAGLEWEIVVREIPKTDMEGFSVRDDDERYIFVYILKKKERTDFRVAKAATDGEEDVEILDPDAVEIFEWPGEIQARRRAVLQELKKKMLPVIPGKAMKEARQKRAKMLRELKSKLLPY